MSGLYIHIPFCRRKCLYCDFFSVGQRLADWPRFVDAAINEYELRRHAYGSVFETIYFGGGTPSLLPDREFSRLAGRFLHDSSPAEFTLEVNPDDVTPDRVGLWAGAGVNRFSIGVQAFDDTILRAMGRRHSAAQAVEAFNVLREAVGNVSLDLIFGWPGQSLDSWNDTLLRTLELRPAHISCYSLMYEPGTPLTRLRDGGKIEEADDETADRMFHLLVKSLLNAGYVHYEISNFALPGFESRHNSAYWSGVPYLGIGPAAHSYDGVRVRHANPPDIAAWARHYSSGAKTVFGESELLSDGELIEEYLLTRLRTAKGVDLDDFGCRFGSSSRSKLINAAVPLAARSLVALSAGGLRLTEKGIMLSDNIILSLADPF